MGLVMDRREVFEAALAGEKELLLLFEALGHDTASSVAKVVVAGHAARSPL
jgi:hypothetical protein